MSKEEQIRYSDQELEEFKNLIISKIAKAEDELLFTQKQIKDLSENGFNQQGGDWYDDTTSHTDLEMLQRMANRQEQFLQNLRNAMYRIENKTYGICSITGTLIDKQRLRLVPHATKSIEGKQIDHSANPVKGADTMSRLIQNEKKTSAQPNNRLRDDSHQSIAPLRKPGASSDWDGPGQSALENPDYAADF